MNGERDVDFDYFDFDDSDQEGAISSEDELDILLHGTPEQKRKLCKLGSGQEDDSSSEDDFEKEMNKELNGTVKALEKRRSSVSDSVNTGASTSGCADDEPQKYIDDVYCDSDEEEMVKEGKKKEEEKHLTNDELLYDPDIDTENEKWMERQRRSYLPPEASTTTTTGTKGASNARKMKPLPNSDAVLDCPACMTTLCLDCQRHDVYENQYRAMFVQNCAIDKSQTLKYPKAAQKSRKRKKQKAGSPQEDAEAGDDDFNPVKCTECNTVVAVYDKDEIYHFFNVLASY